MKERFKKNTSMGRVIATVLCLLAASLTHLNAGWTARTISSKDLFDVSFPAPDRSWAVGKDGAILHSSNGGQNWSAQTSGTASELHSVDFIDSMRGWAVGANDTVVITTNGGANWTARLTGSGANLADVDFVDANNGWAVGASLFLANTIVHTTDGGQTWVQQIAPTGIGLVAVSFSDALHGFAVGFTGVAYRTEDGGQTWLSMVVENSGDSGESFYAVRRLSTTEGIVGGFRGRLYRTQDGGLTWSVVASPGKTIRSLAVAGTSAFAVGDGGLVLRSEDSGQSWETEASGTTRDLKGVSALNESAAFGVGILGVLVEFKVTGVVPLPLAVGPLPESCDKLRTEWVHDVAATLLAAATADLAGDSQPEIIVGGPGGLRALRPFVPTEQSTIWRVPFQARIVQVALAQLDGDATTEIVAATAASGISRSGVFAVEGENGNVKWSRRIPGGARQLRVADFNTDSFQDVVSIGEGRTLSWLDGRDGSDLYPPSALNAGTTDLEVGDLNGGGIADVVVSLSDGRVVAFNGATRAVLWSYQSQAGDPSGGFGGLRAIALGDLNGDGRADVVAVGEGGPVSAVPGNGRCDTIVIGPTKGALIIALNGTDGTRRWDYAELGSEIFQAVSMADFNLDGVPDVVAHASGFGSGHLVALDGRGRTVAGMPTGDAQTLWQFNTTTGTDALQAATTPQAIGIGNGNGDGTPDACVALVTGKMITVSGAVPAAGGTSNCPPPANELWEVQRNGFIYNASFVAINSQPLVLTLSGGDNLATLRNAATGAAAWNFDAGGAPALAIANLDGDGAAEVGVGVVSGRIYGLDGDGSPLATVDNFLPQTIVGLVAADVDGGSSRELIGASSDGTVRAVNPRTGQQIWEQKINAGATAITEGAGLIAVGTPGGKVIGLLASSGAPRWEAPGTARIRALAFVPGANQFVAGDTNGELRFFDITGMALPTASTGTGSFGGVSVIALTDVDGNGTKDLAVAAGRSFFAYRANGSLIWRYDTPAMGFISAAQVAPADLNGDGADEVLGATSDGNAYALASSNGALLWTLPSGIAGSFFNLSGGLAGIDLDDDGKQEALIGTQSEDFPVGQGTLKALRADGTIMASCILRKSPYIIAIGDFDGNGFPDAAVGMLEGDVYLMKGLNQPEMVQPLRVLSRKNHGLAGPFDTSLPLAGVPGVECRSGGASAGDQIVFEFAAPVTYSGASVLPATGKTAEVDGPVTSSADGTEVTVRLKNVTNAQTLTVTLLGVSVGTNSNNIAVPMVVLAGDTNEDTRVNVGDTNQTKSRSGYLTNEDNFRSDVNLDGRINVGDTNFVKSNSGSSLGRPSARAER